MDQDIAVAFDELPSELKDAIRSHMRQYALSYDDVLRASFQLYLASISTCISNARKERVRLHVSPAASTSNC